ncbi:MAG: hypothetical protein CBC48_12635 [bacterium TMED88]|nr:hypothetical protein [Deltaproteobacteria bacterium]OUV28789.1 MAG: hypothetical protein CBC48_12635 [bacterium TMED88]
MRIELIGSTAGQAVGTPERRHSASVQKRDPSDPKPFYQRPARKALTAVKNHIEPCSAVPANSVSKAPSPASRYRRLAVSASASPSARVQWAAIRA